VVTGDGDDAVFVEEEEGSASGSLGSAGRLAEYLRWSHGGQGDSAMAGGEEIGRRTGHLECSPVEIRRVQALRSSEIGLGRLPESVWSFWGARRWLGGGGAAGPRRRRGPRAAEQGERALLGFWGGGASGMGCRGSAGWFKKGRRDLGVSARIGRSGRSPGRG